MPKVEFSKAFRPAAPQQAQTVANDPESEAAQANAEAVFETATENVPPPSQLVTYQPPAYSDDVDDIHGKDVKIPRINIVQKVGDLSNIFTPGDIVLNQQSVIFKSTKNDPKSPPLRVVVCGFRPDRYAERKEGGDLGDIFDSEKQVMDAGGTTDYNLAAQTGRRYFQPLAEALLLIEQPEGIDDPSFGLSADGKLWCAALWAMKGGSYTSGAKAIRTARKFGWLADKKDAPGGYAKGVWLLSTALKAYRTGNTAYVPALRAAGPTSPELEQLALSVLGQ
jgi:hypothetical protein